MTSLKNQSLTVGQLIEDLSKFNPNSKVKCFVNVDSPDEDMYDRAADLEVMDVDKADKDNESNECEIFAVRDNAEVLQDIVDTIDNMPSLEQYEVYINFMKLKKILPFKTMNEITFGALANIFDETIR